MTVVVISSSEKGDRLVESLDVKAPVAGSNPGQIRPRGASNLTGRIKGEPVSLEKRALLEADGRIVGRAEPFRSWRRPKSEWKELEEGSSDLPVDIEGGMPGRNGQRKLGTTRRSPRRSCTAKASRISGPASEIAMCLRVGRMGPISVEGPGQNNPDRSEGL